MSSYEPLTEKKNNFNNNDIPPLITDVLVKVIEKSKKRIPGCMPARSFDAAHWWIGLQEPPHPSRDLPVPTVKDGFTKGWSTPYHDRLVMTLSIFLAMSEPHQTYIVEGIKSGVPWRGDDVNSYVMIVDQHKEMVKDRHRYVANSSAILSHVKTIVNTTVKGA